MFFDHENGQNILTTNFDFRGHISTFHAKTTGKSGTFKAENNAQSTSEQHQNNFQKVQKTTFLALKMVKMTLSEGQILTSNLVLEVIYRPFDLKIHLEVVF